MATGLPVLVNRDLNRAKNKKACDEVIPFVYETVIAWGCRKNKDESFDSYYIRLRTQLWEDNKGEWEKEVEEKLKKNNMTKWTEEKKNKEKENVTEQLKKEKEKEALLIKETWTKEDKENLKQKNCAGLDVTFLHKLVPTICDGIVRYDANAPSSTRIEQFLREVKNIRNDICHDPKGASISDTILDKLEVSAVNVFRAAGDLYGLAINQQDKIRELKENLRTIKTEVMTGKQQRILQTAKKMSEDGMAEMHEAVKRQDTDFLPLSDDKVTRTDIFYSVDLLIKNSSEDDDKDAGTANNKNETINREIPAHELLEHFEGSNVLCEGQPGTGKTTLLKTLREDFGAKTEERFRGVRKFDLLMYMECRNNSVTTVAQLLEHHIPKTFQQLTKKDAVQALRELKLLICVDGLDELTSLTKKLLNELISEFGHGGNATFIFTSRPGQARSVSLSHETVTLQSIKGEEQQVEFLGRYQASIKGFKGPALIEAFKSLNETCKDVLRQPAYLALFCALFRKSPEAVKKIKNEVTLLNDFLKLSQQTMIDRMDKMDLANPVCYADDVTTAIFDLSLCLLQKQEMTLTARTYKNVCRGIFKDAKVEYYPIVSTFFTKHPDQQTFEFYHKSHAEFLAAKAIAQRFVSSKVVSVACTIQAICREHSLYFQDGAVPSPAVTDGEDAPLKRFENVLRFVCMLIHEGGRPMEGALQRFLDEVCPALAREDVGFEYWTALVLSCPDSVQVARAAAEAAHTVSGDEWKVESSRAMTATSKMLPYRQPARLSIEPLQGEEDHAALTALLKAVAEWHTEELSLDLRESHANYSACDASLVCLESARCKLEHFRGCLSGGSSAVWRALRGDVERAGRATLHIRLQHTIGDELGQLDGTSHGLYAKSSPQTPTTPLPPTRTTPPPPTRTTPTTPPPPTRTTTPTTTTAALLQQGRIIIVGGRIFGDSPATPYSMAMFGPALPPFPVLVHGNSLSIVEDTVYSCGGCGSSNSNKKCWATDAKPIVGQTMAWRSIDIPWELGYHSAVVVKNEIWFFLSKMLMIFDTKNPAFKFREFQMEFSFDKVTCAVAHGTKTFVIGVGEEKMEVYVNTDSSKPNQWDKFSTLLQGRGTFGCHVYRGEVFVTGGYVSSTNTHLSSVEAISVVDGTVRSIGPLGGVRADHKMAIIAGRLAVLGGHNGADAMSTIETYDELKNSWETQGHTLGEPRFHFGLAQFLP